GCVFLLTEKVQTALTAVSHGERQNRPAPAPPARISPKCGTPNERRLSAWPASLHRSFRPRLGVAWRNAIPAPPHRKTAAQSRSQQRTAWQTRTESYIEARRDRAPA